MGMINYMNQTWLFENLRIVLPSSIAQQIIGQYDDDISFTNKIRNNMEINWFRSSTLLAISLDLRSVRPRVLHINVVRAVNMYG